MIQSIKLILPSFVLGAALRPWLGQIRPVQAYGTLAVLIDQGWAMGLLPVVVAGLLWVVEPVAMSALVSTWFGLATCVAILVMQLLGLHFIRRVMRIDV